MNRSLARASLNPDVEDVDFFLNEILRHMRMEHKELFSLPPLELLSMVPHPSGTGTLICGYAALKRLTNLVDRALERQRETGKLNPNSVLGELKKILVRRFFVEDAELNTREVSKALSAAIKIVAKDKKERVFYIPCYLGSESSETSIVLGPVEFVSHTIAAERLESVFAAERERTRNEGDSAAEFTEKLLINFARQAKDCLHVAIVAIDSCDFKSAERMAESTVQSAIDGLVLMIGPVHSNYFAMRRHGSDPLKDATLVD